MRLSDYLWVAFKNLARQKIRTFLTVIAITIGSLSLILMASLILSVRQSLIDQFKQMGAFNLVTVAKDPNSTDNNSLMGTNGDPSEGKLITEATLTSMKRLDHVVDGTLVLTASAGTMRLEDATAKSWANLVGIDPNADVITIPIVAGRNLEAGDMDKVVVGSRFVQEIKYSGKEKELVGKTLVINSKMGGAGSSIDWGAPPEKPPTNASEEWYKSQSNKGIDVSAEIVGVANNDTVGNGESYITLDWAKRLNTRVSWKMDDEARKQAEQAQQQQQEAQKQAAKESGEQFYGDSNQIDYNQFMALNKEDDLNEQGYNSIMLKVNDTANIKLVAGEVTKLGYGAITAQSMIDQINQIMMIVSIVLGAIAGISLFVAAIGIINTMIMATYERTREIGVLRACGATRANIRRLFTFEAASLGFWGGVFGLLISYGLVQIAKIIIQKNGASLGSLPIDKIGTFPIWLIVGVILFTTFIGMISGLYPAMRAAKLNPVDALRYE